MSSASLAQANAGARAVWETTGRVYIAQFSDTEWNPNARAVGPLNGAKHPGLATNASGEMLMVWTEGTGWQRGGAMAWQMFDAKTK